MRVWSGLLFALVLAVPAYGHDLTAPLYVLADLHGHFKYNLTLVVTSTTQFDSTHLDGSDNTNVEVLIDGQCLETVMPGTSEIEVDGDLIDESATGTVVVTVNLCDDWTGIATTTVVPYPVADDASTWGQLKSLYR